MTNMQKFLFLPFLLLISILVSSQENYNITATVFDDYGEALPFANVKLIQGEKLLGGVTTDVSGKFIFYRVSPGEYTIEISSLGFNSFRLEKVELKNKDLDLGQIVIVSQEVLLKPIIYLYPEKTSKISIELNYNGNLIYSYPQYSDKGWSVTAHPDGTLVNDAGMEYYGLFWEGIPNEQLHIGEKGFVVKGDETVAFLEKTLETLGLNRREAMEFIIFWQPRMQQNPYNLIYFSTKEYEELAQLNITPQPESIIRVMMVYQPLAAPIEVKPQDLTEMSVERKGFTVVEWGGTELKTSISKY